MIKRDNLLEFKPLFSFSETNLEITPKNFKTAVNVIDNLPRILINSEILVLALEKLNSNTLPKIAALLA